MQLLFNCLQTAHEPSYLVKHLLGSLPPVVDRVKLMRKGQAPNGSQEDNFAKMAQSQVHTSFADMRSGTFSHAICWMSDIVGLHSPQGNVLL